MSAGTECEIAAADLRAGSLIRIRGKQQGIVVRCNHGEVWLTGTNDPEDHVLLAGHTLLWQNRGAVYVQALTDARLSVGAVAGEPAEKSGGAGRGLYQVLSWIGRGFARA